MAREYFSNGISVDAGANIFIFSTAPEALVWDSPLIPACAASSSPLQTCLHHNRGNIRFGEKHCRVSFHSWLSCHSWGGCLTAGRSFSCLSKTVAEIEQQHEGVSLKAIELDLCSLESIVKFRDSVRSWLESVNLPFSVQLLINNAGILATSQRFTSNGYDRMMASNYLGAFMLTHLLLPLLQCSSQPSRIVNVTSFTHRCVQYMQVNEAQLAKGDMQDSSTFSRYQLAHIYESSKLCLLLFTFELHRQLYLGNDLHPISVMAADPGAVETCIFREVPPWLSWLVFKFLKCICLLQSPRKGSRAIIDAALAPPELSGLYFFGGRGRTIEPSSLSIDAELAQRLWKASATLLHMTM